MFKKLPLLLEMIKFEHTIFALPFALTSAIIAANGIPAWNIIFWLLIAMVGARSAAMAFNRIADLKFDVENPRTQTRALPAGTIKLSEAWALVLISSALFIISAAMLNTLALILSPVALLIILGYSYTKRFTSLSHIVLGLALGIAPVGAWIAVRGTIELPPIILATAVMLWTAGFDIIYSLQDVEFDKKAGLFSVPSRIGKSKALLLSRVMHIIMMGLLIYFGYLCGLSSFYFVGIGFIATAIFYEHTLVRPEDLSNVNMAFFTMNGIVSIAYFVFTLIDVWVSA